MERGFLADVVVQTESMVMPLILTVAMISQDKPTEVAGAEVVLRLSKGKGEILEEFFVKGQDGQRHLLLVSPTLTGLALTTTPPAGGGQSSGLYPAAPSLGFTDYRIAKTQNGELVTLSRKTEIGEFEKRILIPETGREVVVQFEGKLSKSDIRVGALFLTYAFLPDGKKLSEGGIPDCTFLPGLRPKDSDVVGDHVFRAPVSMAQKGSLAVLMLPDLDVLKGNRPMETIIDLDCKNQVVDAPLMTYGFASHKVRSHVYYSVDYSSARVMPQTIKLGMTLILDANAGPYAAYNEANNYSWEKYGRRYFDRVLPQALPFEEYAKFCYPASFSETIGDNKLGWFEREIDGHICGGIPAGWGFEKGLLSWQCWFNNLRSAYGLRSFGKRLGNKDWIAKSDKMLNLALAAPMDEGACPTTYDSRNDLWIGSLIQPQGDSTRAYYDLANMAWKGIWMLRWATDFSDCPRRTEVLAACRSMADCMMRNQNKDGSIPSWLTQEHKVIPILDRSAQSALPAWFLLKLAEVVDDAPASFNDRARRSGLAAADFLDKSVVDRCYYYDFETFFSCSRKPFLQKDGVVDHEAMRDPHSLQAPENTLSMQWTAEALRAAYRTTKNQRYMDRALKALGRMELYQNVWPISYRKTAYTYGGFGVQNSDAEYNDARQAQFGETLCDFGAELGRKDLFERGVAAVRASLAVINHPLHANNEIYPNPNYPPGLEPENCCHEGVDKQSLRTGFDWGEGSGLTSMAILLDRYGDVYDAGQWKVGINGIVAAKDGYGRALLWDADQKTAHPPTITVVDAKGNRTTTTAALIARSTLGLD